MSLYELATPISHEHESLLTGQKTLSSEEYWDIQLALP
jgi:hypothetical protein